MSAERLLARSRRLLWLTLAPMLGLVLLLAAWQAWTQWRWLIDNTRAELRTQRFAFEVIARDADNHVSDLRHWMQVELLRGDEHPAPALVAALQPRSTRDGRADGYTLDALPQLLRNGMGQFLWPRSDGAPPTMGALRRAEVLSEVIEVAHQRNPTLVWSYYFGWPDRHLLLFPWVGSQLLVEGQGAPSLSDMLPAWYGYEVVSAGLEAKNPTREAYWTAPYVDAGGQGLLVSRAAPVYSADALRGIVGTDIKLSTMERLLERLPGAPWKAWVVDERGHVLADRQQSAAASVTASAAASAILPPASTASAGASQPAPAASPVPMLAQRLPAGVDGALLAEAARSEQPLVSRWQRVMAVEVGGSPWRVVLAAPEHALWLATLPQVLPYTMIACGLLAVWLLTQAVLRQRVLTPVLEVLGYLQRLSADAGAAEPRLSARWQPWVRTVTRTFAAMREAAQREHRADALKSAIVDHAQSAVVVADAQGRVVEFNPAAEQMFACARPQALGRAVGELLVPERLRAEFDATVAAMRQGDPQHQMGRRLPQTARRADGSEFPTEMVLWTAEAEGASYLTASLTDQTAALANAEVIERQRDALRQSEKLTAMGSLLAGVAHELNNPLAIVMGRATLLEEKTEGSALHPDVLSIREAAERCGRIVRTFLNMARSRPAQRGMVQLNDLVRAATDMLGYTLRSHDITVDMRLADDLPEVLADGDQIGQVVLNLIVNAQQALAAHEGPRRIELRSGQGALADGQCGVWLRIADSGPGVAPSARSRLFEPFFTTKAEGIGTGLGLSVSRAIVRDHGGDLVLEDAPAAGLAVGGACFCLSLPIEAQAPAEAVPVPDSAPTAMSQARVLVVDDEAEIADLLRTMLEAAGCEVATAESGAVALALLESARFDAIVSDLRMPDMDGTALWRAVRAQYPALARRMLFVTGDTLSPGAREFLDETGCPRLDKPFTRADLLGQVAIVLNTEAGDA